MKMPEVNTFLKAAMDLAVPGGYIMFVENGLIADEEAMDHIQDYECRDI